MVSGFVWHISYHHMKTECRLTRLPYLTQVQRKNSLVSYREKSRQLTFYRVIRHKNTEALQNKSHSSCAFTLWQCIYLDGRVFHNDNTPPPRAQTATERLDEHENSTAARSKPGQAVMGISTSAREMAVSILHNLKLSGKSYSLKEMCEWMQCVWHTIDRFYILKKENGGSSGQFG